MSKMNQSGEGNPTGSSGNLRDAAGQVGQSVREMGSQARDVAREQYENLRDQAQEYYEQGREKINEYQESLEEYVRQQPVKSLLIAAGVGLLLGIIWKRS